MDETGFMAAHPDPVLQYESADGTLVVTRVNPAFETAFGTGGGTIALRETLSSDGALSTVSTAIRENEPLDVDVDCPTDDGPRACRLRNVPTDTGGYLVYTGRRDHTAADGDADVSADRLAELEARNERLETFASVVSHDLRNPIDVAETYLEAAREDGDAEHFDRVADALGRMRTLIDDVLALAREGQVVDDTERVTLATVAEDAWHAVDTEAATLHLADETATLQADPDRLQQLLENLVRNALEHGGPTIAVGTIDGDRTGWYLEDDGPGIPEADRDEVFEPGVTSSTEGTGLGLAIVERIAEAHGWDVRITDAGGDADEHREPAGARFEFTAAESLQPF